MSYVDDQFYADLVKSFTDWQRVDLEVSDLQIREQCRMLLEREARLLDQGRFKDWLELYAERCVVWVPGAEPAGDPRREVTVFFDDRRRLEDRIYRLGTGKAWAQVAARTAHGLRAAPSRQDPRGARPRRQDDPQDHGGLRCGLDRHRGRRAGDHRLGQR